MRLFKGSLPFVRDLTGQITRSLAESRLATRLVRSLAQAAKKTYCVTAGSLQAPSFHVQVMIAPSLSSCGLIAYRARASGKTRPRGDTCPTFLSPLSAVTNRWGCPRARSVPGLLLSRAPGRLPVKIPRGSWVWEQHTRQPGQGFHGA